MEEEKYNEINHMLVRLFRLAWIKWRVTQQECADLFDNCKLDEYIVDMYEFFHVQGDDANICDIEEHLKSMGVAYDH